MKEYKLFNSELKVMNILWSNGNMKAKDLAILAKEDIGWNKNTTYTVIAKLVSKKMIERIEPDYICHALITKEEVALEEAKTLIDRLFSGSISKLFSNFVQAESLTDAEILDIEKIIDQIKEK